MLATRSLKHTINCTHTNKYTHTAGLISKCSPLRVCACVCVRVRVRVRMRVCLCLSVCTLYVYVYVCVCLCVCYISRTTQRTNTGQGMDCDIVIWLFRKQILCDEPELESMWSRSGLHIINQRTLRKETLNMFISWELLNAQTPDKVWTVI